MKNAYWPIFVFVLLLLSTLAAAWRWRLEQSRNKKGLDSATALKTCELLLQLVREMQQHRGLSSAWLSGESSFLPRLQEKQSEIANLLPKIKRDARREGNRERAGLTANQFSLFAFRWQCLLDELPELGPEQNIARHNQSISRVLEWLTAMGEMYLEPRVLALSGQDGQLIGVARNFAQRLPQLSECLGQARAIGSTVAAKKMCPPVSRVRLMFLIGRAESLIEQAAMAEPGGEGVAACRESIALLAHTVRTRLLLSTGVLVSASEYFDLSTRAIEDVFAWGSLCGRELEVALTGAVTTYKPQPATACTVCIE